MVSDFIHILFIKFYSFCLCFYFIICIPCVIFCYLNFPSFILFAVLFDSSLVSETFVISLFCYFWIVWKALYK